MLVRMADWEEVRGQFTESEKESLRQATTGEVICPRGLVVDLEVLSSDLRKKLLALLPPKRLVPPGCPPKANRGFMKKGRGDETVSG